jgi:hypothetical protein
LDCGAGGIIKPEEEQDLLSKNDAKRLKPSLRHLFVLVSERHALKCQTRQPKPEPLGAAQDELAEKTDTALNASWPQSGQGAVSS